MGLSAIFDLEARVCFDAAREIFHAKKEMNFVGSGQSFSGLDSDGRLCLPYVHGRPSTP